KAKEKPTVFIDGTRIKSSKDSLYAIELLVKPYKEYEKQAAQPRAAQEKDGQAFAPIDRGEIYELRIFNYAPVEAAVTATIDGLDLFTFSDDRKDDKKDGPPKFSHFFVDPATDGKPGEVTIVGWHKTVDPKRKDNFLSFLVT